MLSHLQHITLVLVYHAYVTFQEAIGAVLKLAHQHTTSTSPLYIDLDEVVVLTALQRSAEMFWNLRIAWSSSGFLHSAQLCGSTMHVQLWTPRHHYH